jgi:hypothetical protein
MPAGEAILPSLEAQSPTVMAQGGSSTALPIGYNALLTNPAGFSQARTELTILSGFPWFYGDPLALNRALGWLPFLPGASKRDGSLPFNPENYVAEEADRGVGIGWRVGIGLVGNGLGLGFFHTSSVLLDTGMSASPATAKGFAASSFSLVGGFALTPIKNDTLSLRIGADLRPTVLFFAPLDEEIVGGALRLGSLYSRAMVDTLNRTTLSQGAALALDTGALLDIGDFSIGISIRDVFDTRFAMSQYRFGSWVETASTSGIPNNSRSTMNYRLPMTIRFGVGYKPERPFARIVPSLHGDVDDVMGFLRNPLSPLHYIRLGSELSLFNTLKIRGGFDKGAITAGLGLRIFFFDLNAAAALGDMVPGIASRHPGGISVELAFRL